MTGVLFLFLLVGLGIAFVAVSALYVSSVVATAFFGTAFLHALFGAGRQGARNSDPGTRTYQGGVGSSEGKGRGG